MSEAFRPTIFLKEGCPFCFKLRVALLEAGMLDAVAVREFRMGTPEETAFKSMLSSKLEKVSFPAAEIARGEFKTDSDELIGHFLGSTGIDEGALPTLQAYKNGPFKELIRLFKENTELKKGLVAGT